MEQVLSNPVYHALNSNDAHLGSGSGDVKYFHAEVSPFVAFPEDCDTGFEQLFDILPAGRRILYATRISIQEPKGWQIRNEITGLQFVFTGASTTNDVLPLVPLENMHVNEMIELATLTKPGPFDKRTIEFGHYYGVFDNNRLVAMTGQRLHPYTYTEISAVCTHPAYLGRGYAAALIQRQLQIICNSGQVPFLHVRDDNERAISVYERLGFARNGPMNFYFMKKR